MRVEATAVMAALLLTPQSLPPFRAETRLVVLQTTVKNSRGELVTDLDRGAFTVYEDGKPQPISVFSRDDIPVSMGLLIDNSGSMRDSRARVEAAALALVRASNPQDETFVINFADSPRVDVPFTSDPAVLQRGLARVDSIGGTALRDAIALGEIYVSRGARDHKVLVVITDGKDTGSQARSGIVRDLAERHGVVLYAIVLANTPDGPDRRGELPRLVERTGGLTYFPADLDEVDRVALDIAHQIRSQYTIGYTPLNQAFDGRYRKLTVRVAARDGLVVRTRAGYVASPR